MVQKLHKMEKGFNFNAIIVNKFTDRGDGEKSLRKSLAGWLPACCQCKETTWEMINRTLLSTISYIFQK